MVSSPPPPPQESSSLTWTTRTRFFSFTLLALAILQLKPEVSFLDTTSDSALRNKHPVKNVDKTVKTANATKVVFDRIQKLNENSKKARNGDKKVAQTKASNITSPSTKTKTAQPKEKRHVSYVKFNYTLYWEQAMEAAFASLKTEEDLQATNSPPSPCPKVYVYNLPNKLRDGPRKLTKKNTFGSRIGRGMYANYLFVTSQYALPSILEYRLRTSKRCFTNDPNEADLFYAPVLTKPKFGREISRAFHKTNGKEVRNAMIHLNSTNACKHFFVLGKGHYNGHSGGGWYINPIKELMNTQRLAYSHVDFSKSRKEGHSYKKKDTTIKMYPNLWSAPYPSSIHYRAETPTKNMPQFRKMRNRLMSFIGKSNHGDQQVRKRIVNMCKKYKSNSICRSSGWKPALATAKASSVFCLEPAGDSPWRKSISDSITFGCIPVLFSDLTDDVAPWFWQDWKARGRVLVPRDEFVAGRIDLKMLLQSMPSELLELMQTTLREKSRRFQYSIDDDQHDGVRIILDNLHREAIDMERRGVCGYN